jgi:hypothetical protein
MKVTCSELEYPLFRSMTAGVQQLNSNQDCFSVEQYLKGFQEKLSFDYHKERSVLHKLAKKVDVVKSLKAFYSGDLSKAVSEDLVSDQFICLLVEIFLYCALNFKDYKLLNSSLKIFDGILENRRNIEGLDNLNSTLKRVMYSV